jgi:hypothetical protein
MKIYYLATLLCFKIFGSTGIKLGIPATAIANRLHLLDISVIILTFHCMTLMKMPIIWTLSILLPT